MVVALARLYARYKSGKFGSRLMARLVLLFAGIGILPGLVIFLVSVQFVSHSIESWFDVKIEAALESGLNLGVAALDQSLAELGASAACRQRHAGRPGPRRHPGHPEPHRQRAGRRAKRDAGRRRRQAAGRAPPKTSTPTWRPTCRPRRCCSRRDAGRVHPVRRRHRTRFQGRGDGGQARAPNALDAATGLRLRVVLAVPEPPGAAPRFLQLVQSVPVNLATNAEVLRNAYSEYQARFVARVGLRKMYIETLTLTLLLAIFGAVASAFLIASNLAQPLLVLAEGTRAVAEGDLSPRPIVTTSDELGTLTQSFNTMTGQLFEARSAVERNRAALQSAKAHLESVLANMSAGVIVLDAEFNVVNSNEAVDRILLNDVSGHLGSALSEIEGLRSVRRRRHARVFDPERAVGRRQRAPAHPLAAGDRDPAPARHRGRP